MRFEGDAYLSWNNDLQRRAAAGRKQLLARAVGLHRQRHLRILDATAGFGRDAALLAMLGAEVVMCERHPQLHAYLEHAVQSLPEAVRSRLTLYAGDAREQMRRQDWDVVYLDPMYSPSRKTALPDARAQQLRALVGHDSDADALLALARAAARRRAVVKRALRAPPLADIQPMESLRGNSVRFDLYNPFPKEAS